MIQLLHANPNKVLTIKVDILTIETALIDNHMHPLDILFQSTYLIPHNFILLILLLKTLNLLGQSSILILQARNLLFIKLYLRQQQLFINLLFLSLLVLILYFFGQIISGYLLLQYLFLQICDFLMFICQSLFQNYNLLLQSHRKLLGRCYLVIFLCQNFDVLCDPLLQVYYVLIMVILLVDVLGICDILMMLSQYPILELRFLQRKDRFILFHFLFLLLFIFFVDYLSIFSPQLAYVHHYI